MCRVSAFNGPVFAALHRVAPAQLLAGLAVLTGLVTASWLRIRKRNARVVSRRNFLVPICLAHVSISSVRARRIPMVSSLAVAISDVASMLPIIVWTVSIIPVYVMWHWRTHGHPWGALPGWVMLLEYGCVAIAAAIFVFPQEIAQVAGSPTLT